MSRREIILELTGPLERAVGRSCIVYDCASEQTLGTVLARLISEYPAASGMLGDAGQLSSGTGALPPGVLIVRESQTIPARRETPVAAGDRLTLMALISGG